LNSKNKKLGIFVCTRKRVDSLKKLIESVFSLCHDKDNIDLWIGHDEDDHETSSFLLSHKEKSRINTYSNTSKSSRCVFCSEDYVNRHNDIIQPMVDRSDSDYLWVLNDDLVIKTEDFDSILERHIENFLSDKQGRIFYGMPLVHFINERGLAKDTFSLDLDNKLIFGTEYSCYPMVTRETEEVLGYFLPTSFAAGGADIVLGAGMGLSNYCRKLDLPIVLHDKLIETFKRVRPWEVLPSGFIEDNGGIQGNNVTQPIIDAYINVLEMNNLSCDHYDEKTPSPQREIMKVVEVLDNNIKNKRISDSIRPEGIDISLIFKCPNCQSLYKSPTNYRMDKSNCTNCGKSSYITSDRHGYSMLLDLQNRMRHILPEIKKGV
tara:strand:+ start:5249 stop:6379 length:1131 start_codon:yes stop_codon:yes gene_type:complete